MESTPSKMSSSSESASSAAYAGSKGSSASSREYYSDVQRSTSRKLRSPSKIKNLQRSTSRKLRSPSKVKNLPKHTPNPSPCKEGWTRVGRRGSNSSNSSPISQPYNIHSNVDFPRLQLSPGPSQRRTSSSSEDPYQKVVKEALR